MPAIARYRRAWPVAGRRASCSRRAVVAPRCAGDMSARALESIANMALKVRLRRCDAVRTSVNCTAGGLLLGRIEGVNIRGNGWLSPLGLSARHLEADLGHTQIDVRQLLLQQQIVLQNKPRGRFRVVMSPGDFGNLLVHPLMVSASASALQGRPFQFSQRPVELVQDGAATRITFSGTNPSSGVQYQLHALPGPAADSVCVRAVELATGRPSADVSAALTAFFRALALDLDGVELRFDSIAVQGHAESAAVRVGLSMMVHDFPAPSLSF